MVFFYHEKKNKKLNNKLMLHKLINAQLKDKAYHSYESHIKLNI